MSKIVLLTFLFPLALFAQKSEQYFTRQGQVTFFSYTSVENIQAINNQAYSIFDVNTGEVAASILMRAFKFKKSLMQEHFNVSYIESDLYPKATFEGKAINFNKNQKEAQTHIIKGNFTLRGKTKPIEFRVQIIKNKKGYTISGDLEVEVKDYDIKIHPLIEPNIAKVIKASFNFQYDTLYDE